MCPLLVLYCTCMYVQAGLAQSVQRLTSDWTVQGSNPSWGENFRTRSQPPVQQVPGLFPGVRRPGRGVGHPTSSSADVKERVELYLYSLLWTFKACSRVDFIFTCVCVYVCACVHVYACVPHVISVCKISHVSTVLYGSKIHTLHIISDFRRKVDEICALLGYYAAYSGNSLPTFRYNRSRIQEESFFLFLTRDDNLSRNVGKDLPLHAA